MTAITSATRTVEPVTTEDSPRALVRTRGLTKRFRHAVVVDDVALEVPAGAVYGFLGPNGSGKTTTIRMLLGLIRPVAGEVELLGQPIPARSADALPRVGSLVEGPAFHPYLSGRANLARLDAADPAADPRTTRARIDAALDRVGRERLPRAQHDHQLVDQPLDQSHLAGVAGDGDLVAAGMDARAGEGALDRAQVLVGGAQQTHHGDGRGHDEAVRGGRGVAGGL